MESDNSGLGLVSYNFEPEYTEDELSELQISDSHSDEERLPTTIDDFCDCENCVVMATYDENLCCRASDLTVGNLEDNQCITEHCNFDTIVLNPAVLEVAFIQIMAYKGNRGRAPDTLTNQQSRLTAYRQFVCWMMQGEKLGKGKRVVIPACVVNRIRQEYPATDNDYKGFKSVIDNMRDLF